MQEQESPQWYEKITLVQATGILVCLAMLMVCVGYLVYWNSPDRKYDIARPGNNEQNKATSVEDSFENDTSPVDRAAIEKKRKFLQDEQKALKAMNNFRTPSLSDQSLHLAPSEDPSF